MQNNSTPSANEGTSASVEIVVDCVLFDTSAQHHVSCADVVLIDSKHGTRVYGTTDPKGQLREFYEIGMDPAHWDLLKLPHGGDWLIDPNTEKFDTHYSFKPLTVSIPDYNTHIEPPVQKVEVDGDNKKNNDLLELYVENVFIAGKNIFMEELKRHLPGDPSEGDIENATNLTSQLVGNALAFITQSGYTSIESEHVRHLCKSFLSNDGDGSLRDNIPCSLCYTRYGSNPTRLQTCICCAPCTAG